MPIINGYLCKEVRCQGELPDGNTCNTLLGYEAIAQGGVIFKCPRCNKITSIFTNIPKKYRDEVLDDYAKQRKAIEEARGKKKPLTSLLNE